MAKTVEQIEKDLNALLRYVFTAYEELAQMEPLQALHPYELHERKRLLRRKVWELHAHYMRLVAPAEEPTHADR